LAQCFARYGVWSTAVVFFEHWSFAGLRFLGLPASKCPSIAKYYTRIKSVKKITRGLNGPRMGEVSLVLQMFPS
jgi:hypothetical protein